MNEDLSRLDQVPDQLPESLRDSCQEQAYTYSRSQVLWAPTCLLLLQVLSDFSLSRDVGQKMRKAPILGGQKKGLRARQCSRVPQIRAGVRVWRRDQVSLEILKHFSSTHTPTTLEAQPGHKPKPPEKARVSVCPALTFPDRYLLCTAS